MPKVKEVNFDEETQAKIAGAILDILDGACSKVIISDDVKVYSCTNIIRIDLKVAERG